MCWDESWLTARTIGLALNADQEGGYHFLLTTESLYSWREDRPVGSKNRSRHDEPGSSK